MEEGEGLGGGLPVRGMVSQVESGLNMLTAGRLGVPVFGFGLAAGLGWLAEESREVSPEERRRKVFLGRGAGGIIVEGSGVGGSRWAGDTPGEEAWVRIARSRV